MFRWLFQHDPRPFKPEWAGLLAANVWQYKHLREPHRRRVHEVVAHLVARKTWAGAGGLEVDDTMRVTVSGVAALFTLGLEAPYFFPRLISFVLYPRAFQDPDPGEGAGLLGAHEPLSGGGVRLGEAWPNSPVVLSWRAAQRQARVPGRGRNLVLHEMAHHIDGSDGEMDGAPRFGTPELRRRWFEVSDKEYYRLLGQSWRREPTLLDPYGATNRAEFFAVVSECFLERPHEMRDAHRELYELLTLFYEQDPADWLPRREPTASAVPRRKAADPAVTGREYVEQLSLDEAGLSEEDQLYSKGVLMLNYQEYAEAERLFSQVLAKDPGDGEALQHRAEARLGLGGYREAIEDAEAALAEHPEEITPKLVIAEASLSLGDDARARRLIREALREDKSNGAAWRLRGRLHARAGDLPEAAAAFRRALQDLPYCAETYCRLADCLDALNEPDQADKLRQRAFDLDASLEGVTLAV